jgi:ABC-type multidrug transport system ATPase subunit
VDGEIFYGDMTGDKALRPYKTDVIFNPEEDIFDPNLTVGRTLDFALRMNTPAPGARLPKEEGGEPMTDVEYRAKMKKDLMDVLGLSHTHDTKVGDQYVRGVSGGEKKRVSIAEVLTSGASVQMWDNATRGLDADTALRYTRIIRALTDVQRNASVVSLYQAGNGIYDQFDKVTVIAEGQVIYYGPRAEARGYFEEMGFVHPDGGNTADFLTSVTALNERQVKDGAQVPDNARDLARAYANSDIARRMKAELDEHLSSEAVHSDTVQAQEELQRQKDKRAIKRLPQRANYWTQVKAALIRDYQQRWGDQWTFWARQFTTTVQALLAGSTFYKVSDNTGGLFTRGGIIFLTILYPSLISLAETTAAFTGRAVTSKHKAFSMYRPSAVYIAQTIGDLPIFFVQIALYTIIIYFMTGLKRDAGNYFTYLLITYVTTLCTTAFFRFIGYSFGTFENASKVSGFMFSVIVTYAGTSILIIGSTPGIC